MSRRINDIARIALEDIHALVALIDDATRNLDLGLAGWPEQTPGASPASGALTRQCVHRDLTGDPDCTNDQPCPNHDPEGGIFLTAVERNGTRTCTASRDLDELTAAVKAVARHARRAATIAHRWGLQGVTDTDVKAKLTVKARIDDIWCANCGRWGSRNVRLEGQTECDFCSEFRRDYNRPAPEAVLKIFGYRRVTQQDKERILDGIDPGWRKKLKKGKAA